MHLFVIPHGFLVALVCAVALLALWKGGWRTRALSLAQVVLFAAEPFFCHTWACWAGPERPLMLWRLIAEDSAMLALCLVCAFRADRYWVFWTSSLSLLCVITDAMGLMPGLTSWAFASAAVVWGYLTEVTIAMGVWSEARAGAAQRRFLTDGGG